MDYIQPILTAILQAGIISGTIWYGLLEISKELREHEQKLHSQYLAQRERHHNERLSTIPPQPDTIPPYDDSEIRNALLQIQNDIKQMDREIAYAVQKAEEGADLAARRVKSASTKEQRAEELLGLREQIKQSILEQTAQTVQTTPLPGSGKRIPRKI